MRQGRLKLWVPALVLLLVHVLPSSSAPFQYDAAPGCRFIINEVNSNNPRQPETKEFIELRQFCSTGDDRLGRKSLAGYKLIVIGHSGARGFVLELVADLTHFYTTKEYFVLGGTDINVEGKMDISHEDVKGYRKFTAGDQRLNNFIPDGRSLPSAVALLYDSTGVNLNNVFLSSQRPIVQIEEVADVIRENIVDMVVFGRRSPAYACDIFEYLAPELRNRPIGYVLRDYDVPNSEQDLSVNHCGFRLAPFRPAHFKVGELSPGSANDCTMANVILKKVLGQIVQPLVLPLAADDMETDHVYDEQCSALLPVNALRSVTTDSFNRARERVIAENTAVQCRANNDLITFDEANLEDELARHREYLRKLTRTIVIPDWESTDLFKEYWIGLIEQYQSSVMPTDVFTTNPEIRKWFQYNRNRENPAQSTYMCRICFAHFDSSALEERIRPKLASPFLGDSVDVNRDAMVEHSGDIAHKAIIHLLADESLSQDSVLPGTINNDDQTFKVTANMMRTVYVETKTNIAFHQHPNIVMLQKLNGADLGTRHFSDSTARTMMTHISNEFRRKLLSHLLGSQEPFSIIVDTSTDLINGIKYLIVYFQHLENSRPVVYFYRLIELGADITGHGIFKSFYAAIQEDSLEDRFRRDLVGMASDGESTMIGERNSFKAFLLKKLDRKDVYGVHCMAHRLHLAIRKPCEEVKDFKQLEDMINGLYSFYHHNSKCDAHLRQTTMNMHQQLRKLGYIYTERWVTSEYTALQQVSINWNILIKDLIAIKDNIQGFSADLRQRATELVAGLTTRIFVTKLAFLLDVMASFAQFVKLLEVRNGLLVDKEGVRLQMLQSIAALRQRNGGSMIAVLTNAFCMKPGSEPTICTTIEAFENSAVVSYRGYELLNTPERLGPMKTKFLAQLQTEVERRFPAGGLSMFSVLDPRRIPLNPGRESFGKQEMKLFEETFPRLFPTPGQLYTDWITLLEAMVRTRTLWRSVESDVHNFWPVHLRTDGLPWTEYTRALIRIVLVLPAGSAEAERGFSAMKRMVGTERGLLASKTLDDLMRVRLNGPDNLGKFDAIGYARSWVESNRFRTDGPQSRHVVEDLNLVLKDRKRENSYLAKSELF